MTQYDIGFLGGGQLARMSIQAAQRMGLRCLSLDPGQITPASQIADALVGSLSDPHKIAKVIQSCRYVTLENEFIPASALREAFAISGESDSKIRPGIDSLATIQDKLLQRQAYTKAGAPTPFAVPLEGNGEEAIEKIGFPMVLKARFGGYDGKGTRYARIPEELESYRELWGAGGWLAEQFVPFDRELAVMVYRYDGQVGAFKTVETIQTNHVCDLVFPCDADASKVAIQAVEAVQGEGLFGVELFETAEGEILINEIAPRPHNSGHYTMDGWSFSQFQAHVYAVMGLPMPELIEYQPVVMANLLGQEGIDTQPISYKGLDSQTRLHWYGKAESRPGRKMGHMNYLCDLPLDPAVLDEVRKQRDAFYALWKENV